MRTTGPKFISYMVNRTILLNTFTLSHIEKEKVERVINDAVCDIIRQRGVKWDAPIEVGDADFLYVNTKISEVV